MKLAANSDNDRSNRKPTYRKASSSKGSEGVAAKAGSGTASGERKDAAEKAKDTGKGADSAKDARKGAPSAKHAAHSKDAAKAKDTKKRPGDEGGKHDAEDSKRGAQDGASGDHGRRDDADEPRVKPATVGQKGRTPEISVKRRRPVGVIVAAAVVAVLIVAGVGFGVASQGGSGDVPDASNTNLEFSDPGYNASGELINPIDWDEWVARNPDVYAWLQIDGTKVDHPILQHPLVDDYYLMRNIDGQPEVNGTLYTQVGHNSKDLEEDPVTIVYGHTFEQNDTMFTTLHNLEDPDAFEAVPTFCVYTPEERLEYEIVSAFEYDNSHILEANDMTDPEVRAEFFEMVQNPSSINKNVRQLEGKLNPDKDKLLILSTCTQPANDNARYLVVAVLRDVEKTEDPGITEDEGEVHVFTREELDAMAAAE